jgi:L-lactate dehydrogenase (cytochrome)/(S)-mandelate dehydrogenase
MANPFANARFRWSENTELLSVEDFRNAARRRLPHMVWAYVDGGAEDLLTLNANRDAFARWRFRPKTLAGHERFDLRTGVCGTELSMPVFLAPTAMSGLAHWTGELAGAKAAERAGTRMVLSTAASYTPEEIAEATAEQHFFQLYPWADVASGGRALSGELMQRAWSAGYRAIFVTVDVPTHGNRESERRHGMGVKPMLTPRRIIDLIRKQQWTRDYLRRQRATPRLMMELMSAQNMQDTARRQIRVMRPELNWEDLRWMREQWHGQFYVKGILHQEDAERAVGLGVDGIVVSNHGGRQLDGAQASLDALPDIVAQVNKRVPVLLDGGVRRGADVVKALCLGASAVGIGRPWLYGLAVNGGAGVEQILAIFREEMLRTLTLLGCPSVSALDRSMLV